VENQKKLALMRLFILLIYFISLNVAVAQSNDGELGNSYTQSHGVVPLQQFLNEPILPLPQKIDVDPEKVSLGEKLLKTNSFQKMVPRLAVAVTTWIKMELSKKGFHLLSAENIKGSRYD
jgi:hypothetical protein